MPGDESRDIQQSLPLDFPGDGKEEEGNALESDSPSAGTDSSTKEEAEKAIPERSDTVGINADTAKSPKEKQRKEEAETEKAKSSETSNAKTAKSAKSAASNTSSKPPRTTSKTSLCKLSSSKTQGSFLPGQILQAARKDADLSLDQVHMATKIKKNAIQALEDGDVEALPSQVFAEAYIKRICALYAIDSEEPVELFRKHYQMEKGKHMVPGEVLQDIQSGTQVNMKEEERVRRMVKIVLASVLVTSLLALAIVKLFPWASNSKVEEGTGEDIASGMVESPQDTVATTKALEVFLLKEPSLNMTKLSVPDHE